MTLEEVRRNLRKALAEKYDEREAGNMAMLIMQHLKGWSVVQVLANESREASEYIVNSAREIITKLMSDMPLQYALGEAHFYGLSLKVVPGVLIPRPETEQLVDLIVKENDRPDLAVLDLCTGSGAIAIALARNLPFSKVEAVDISPVAVKTALENAENLNTRITVRKGDIFSMSFLPDSFDIIVSNPPYIVESEKIDMAPNVLKFEPEEALFVPDNDPLKFYDRTARIGLEALKSDGKLYFEINPLFSERLKTMLLNLGYVRVEIIKDINGKDRFATALK